MDPIYIIGAIATVITAVVGAGMGKKWVWGWVYADLEKSLVAMTADRNFWRDTALELLKHTRAVEKGLLKDEKK